MEAQNSCFVDHVPFSTGGKWNLMIVLDLYFVDFSERCTKRKFFLGGLEECHRKAPCP